MSWFWLVYFLAVSPELTGGPHLFLNGLSKLVEIRETPTVGKHAVAADNIKIGDTVASEIPLASCLLPEYYGTHCHHCFVRYIKHIYRCLYN